MSLPFHLPIGRIVLHQGRRIRFEGDLGDWTLRFSDVRTGAPFQVQDPKTGSLVLPTVEWVRQEFLVGRLVDPVGERQSIGDRRNHFAGLDATACSRRDRKVLARSKWAIAAIKAGLPRTDEAYGRFIETHAEEFSALTGRKQPSCSTLRRWVRKFEAGGARVFTLVSLAGRRHGCSQLCKTDDRLVHEAAIYYWAEARASIKDAEAYMRAERDKLIEAGADLPSKAPSYEAVRLRVRLLETFETHKRRFGKASAEKRFGAVGESIQATRFGERIYGDGTELRPIAVFDSDWPLAAGKMKTVAFVDGFTLFIFPPAIFAGPYREEMSVQALLNVMIPPELSDELIAEYPWLAWAYITPETVVVDNERSLVGPGYVPALDELGPTLELAGVYDHDAKSPIEGIWRCLKKYLDGLPGTVRGPRHPKDPTYDPVAGAELTREQLRAIILAFVHRWNTTPKKCLGDRSPLDLVRESILASGGQVRLQDPGFVKRSLAKTIEGCVLTTDGVVYDNIRYRGDAVEQVLKDNYRNTPNAQRIDGPGKCITSIRVFDGDIDSIDVLDIHNNRFVTLYSVQPRYTGMLSRWEHDQYRKMARARGEKFDTEAQRIRSRIQSLRTIDINAPKEPLRRRNAMHALYECAQIRRLSGERAKSPDFERELPDDFFPMTSATGLRRDVPAPPPGPAKTESRAAKRHPAPPRPDDYYSASVQSLPPPEASAFDWSKVEEELPEDNDPESFDLDDEEDQG